MGFRHALQCGAKAGRLGCIDRDSGAAANDIQGADVEHAALTAGNDRHTCFE
jgi:hypothetical protein